MGLIACSWGCKCSAGGFPYWCVPDLKRDGEGVRRFSGGHMLHLPFPVHCAFFIRPSLAPVKYSSSH